MPHATQEARQEWIRQKRESDPEWAEKRRAYARAYRAKNSEAARKSERKSYRKRRKAKLEQARDWRQRNPDKVREYAMRQRNRNQLNHNMRTLVWKSLKQLKQGRKWTSLVGYTVVELKEHLESLFLPGMTWDNYGRGGWHIDHIRPVDSFNITSVDCDDFKVCWALSNLQPLWEEDNVRKRNQSQASASLAKYFGDV